MKIDTLDDFHYISGLQYGLDKSVKIHRTAVIRADIEIGPGTRIDGGVTITGHVRIGRNCHISVGASLLGMDGIYVGDHCGISAGCRLFTGTDDPDSGRLSLHAENELPRASKHGPIGIMDYVIIGSNSVVMPNVVIGEAAMVGALSFVKHSLMSNMIYAGNPLRLIRPRPPLEYRRAA